MQEVSYKTYVQKLTTSDNYFMYLFYLDYKRARSELKKRSTDTLRLQKKLKKGVGGDVQKRFECGLQDVTERRQLLEETEKHAARAALIEERTRFCSFVGLLKPVVVSVEIHCKLVSKKRILTFGAFGSEITRAPVLLLWFAPHHFDTASKCL